MSALAADNPNQQSAFQKQHNALIICDLQNDLLKSISPSQSKILFTSINTALDCVRSVNANTSTSTNNSTNTSTNTNNANGKNKWTIIFTGLKFQKEYANVPPAHKLYGGMKRLNHKMGNKFAHWFMEGYDGVSISSAVHVNANTHSDGDSNGGNNDNEFIIWRDRHLHSQSTTNGTNDDDGNNNNNNNNNNNLQTILSKNKITNAIVCGMKTSTTIQSTIQLTCDLGIQTSVLKEAVVDDNMKRHDAIMEYLVPIYSNVMSLHDFIDFVVGMENISDDCQKALIEVELASVVSILPTTIISNCNDKKGELKKEEGANTNTDLLPTQPNKKVVQPVVTDNEITKEDGNKKSNNNSSISSSSSSSNSNQKVYFLTDCERGGHGKRYIQFLLERNTNTNTSSIWKHYPTQPWYENFHGSYICPMGKKIVDFCDEPTFSKLSMYLSGREWLDEKDKVIQISIGYMPTTYIWEPSSTHTGIKGRWKDDICPPTLKDIDMDLDTTTSVTVDDAEASIDVNVNANAHADAPWFIKEADKNLGGPYIGICQHPSQIPSFIKHDKRYVVQQHIKDPLLTDDGKKTHVKFYILLICDEEGEGDDGTSSATASSWSLYTYKNAKLSISPNKWSPTDLSQDTQVTIHRHPIPPNETIGWKQHWEETYLKCQQGTADVIGRAIRMGKLKGRKGKKQFEVFSADWMPDEHGNIWLFEFNMSPAVCQKEFDDEQMRDERRDKLMRDDETMLRDALSIVLPLDGKSEVGLWDKVDILQE